MFRVSVARSGQQRAKAVNRQPVLGLPGGLFGDGGRGAFGLGNDAGALCFGGLLIGVVVEHGRQTLAHVPFQILGEHAQKHVGADAICQPVINRPDLQVDGLEAAEGALDQAQRLVAAHRGSVVEHR